MFQLLPYPFKVWITSVVVGSALFTIWIKVFEATSHTVLKDIYLFTFVLTVTCSGLISVPAFLLLWFAYWFTVKKSFTMLATKLLLVLVSLVLAFITIRMMVGVENIKFWSSDNLDLFLCYWLVLAAGIMTYKLDRPLYNTRRQLEQ
jgi:hypothetical protein